MDKQEFVSEAPRYYALAICVALESGGTLSKHSIEDAFRIDPNTDDHCLIGLSPVWTAAVDWLRGQGMIAEMKGAFGPALYAQSQIFRDKFEILLDRVEPFSFFRNAPDQRPWLLEALNDIDRCYNQLDIIPDDFTQLDTEWTPIQIDPADPVLQNAIEQLSTAVEEIRKDNGYAAKVPEERNYVVDGLSNTVGKLKSGTISAGYLRDAWNRLTIVGRRFAGAALEAVITGAKQAIIELVKSQGGALFQALLHLFR